MPTAPNQKRKEQRGVSSETLARLQTPSEGVAKAAAEATAAASTEAYQVGWYAAVQAAQDWEEL